MNLENPHYLLTTSPLSTSPAVRQAMLRDGCTWNDYNLGAVTPIPQKFVLVDGEYGNRLGRISQRL